MQDPAAHDRQVADTDITAATQKNTLPRNRNYTHNSPSLNSCPPCASATRYRTGCAATNVRAQPLRM